MVSWEGLGLGACCDKGTSLRPGDESNSFGLHSLHVTISKLVLVPPCRMGVGGMVE